MTNPARHYKVALQVNPYGYLAKNAKADPFGSEAAYTAAIVAACVANRIELVGVTDHHSISESIGLITALTDAGIVVFPGFEANTADGVHFLCLFDPATPLDTIDRCIGDCGIIASDQAPQMGKFTSVELLERVREWGAVGVAAHVDGSKGLLTQLSGQPCIAAWTSDHLIACAVSSELTAVDAPVEQILRNLAPAYERPHPVAVIHANDVCAPGHLDSPLASTYLKMAAPTIDGLRHAFLDPGSRVRRHDQASPEAHPFFKAVAIEGGFLNGLELSLSPALNVVIGPRGSGKSTLIEAVRFLVDASPIGATAESAHSRFVADVLGPGARVSAEVESSTGEHFSLARNVDSQLVIDDANGVRVSLSIADILGQITILGQHEIAELSRHRDRCARLIERFVPKTPATARDGIAIVNELAANRERVAEQLRESSQLSTVEAELDEVDECLDAFDKAKLKDRLDRQAALKEEEPLLTELSREIEEAYDDASFDFPIDLSILEEDALAGRVSLERFREIRSVLTAARDLWSDHSAQLTAAMEDAKTRVADVLSQRASDLAAEDAGLQQTLRELNAENVNGARYLQLKEQRAQLGIDKRKLERLRVTIAEGYTHREALVSELNSFEDRRCAALEAAAKLVNERLYPNVRVEIRCRGDRQLLIEHLRTHTRGQLHKVDDALANAEEMKPSELRAVIEGGVAELSHRFGITEGQAQKLVDLSADALLGIDEIVLPATMEIMLNLAPEGEKPVWTELDHLSTGQKATAVLLLLLLGSNDNGPLVIDQAEDDLDNAFIADVVVQRLRQEKDSRQFMLSTHNPNIPVLGDAELVARLRADGEAATGGKARIEPEATGSIDTATVRAALEGLEGGRLAFDTRRRRYRF